jgi:hypothetical protein
MNIQSLLIALLTLINLASLGLAQDLFEEAISSEKKTAQIQFFDKQIIYQFAVYYLPESKNEPLAELDKLLKGKFSQFKRVEKLDGKEKSPSLTARIENDPQKEYAPTDLESLKYFGHGLSKQQAEALQKTKQVIILDFSYPNEFVWKGLHSANELIHTLAVDTDGLVWDETTRLVFTPKAWEEKCLKEWADEIPEVSTQFTISRLSRWPKEIRLRNWKSSMSICGKSRIKNCARLASVR